MAAHAFDLAQFQAMFPELAAVPGVLDGTYWTMATGFMTSTDGIIMAGASLQLGLNLMTAHLAKLIGTAGASASSGTAGGPITSATQGSVSIAFAPPPFKTGWQFWLSSTPYGLQLWALLQVQSAGGLYIGGSLDRASFRGAGGVFGSGGSR
jgi:hypothetical protein